MIADLLIHVSGFITHTIDSLGYLGVVLLMAIESAAIPLPSEIIMPFAGYLVESNRFNLFYLGLAGASGSTIGSLVTYYLGYHGGRRLVEKYGHFVFLSQSDLDLTEKFFRRFKHTSTFFGRVIPIIRTFISIPAGIAKTPVTSFTLNAFLGSFIWSYFLAVLGLKLGENWKRLEIYFHKFDGVILILFVVGVIYWVIRHFKHRLRS